MENKIHLPNVWIRKRVKAYMKNGETVESAHDHAIMDYLDELYLHGCDFIGDKNGKQ